MSSFDFNYIVNRVTTFNESKKSPYEPFHPKFGNITSTMRKAGFSSAPLDTIKFIRETLYYLDIISDEELSSIKKAPGFSGKKQALLTILAGKRDEINQRSEEISRKIEEDLQSFIDGVVIDRGRGEKYAAQAAAREIEKQLNHVNSGKPMDDALSDSIGEELLVRTAIGKVLGSITSDLGGDGLDIDEQALDEVISYSGKIKNIDQLKSFINQIKTEPGYEKIAAYLASAIKPLKSGLQPVGVEDEEFNEFDTSYEDEDAEDAESVEDTDLPSIPGVTFVSSKSSAAKKLLAQVKPLSDWASSGSSSSMVSASTQYTSNYITEQVKKDERTHKPRQVYQTFKDRYAPKTHWQLKELKRYGL